MSVSFSKPNNAQKHRLRFYRYCLGWKCQVIPPITGSWLHLRVCMLGCCCQHPRRLTSNHCHQLSNGMLPSAHCTFHWSSRGHVVKLAVLTFKNSETTPDSYQPNPQISHFNHRQTQVYHITLQWQPTHCHFLLQQPSFVLTKPIWITQAPSKPSDFNVPWNTKGVKVTRCHTETFVFHQPRLLSKKIPLSSFLLRLSSR